MKNSSFQLKCAESKYIDLTTILGVTGTEILNIIAVSHNKSTMKAVQNALFPYSFWAKLYVLHMVITFNMPAHISWFPNRVPHATCPQQTRRHEENLISIIRL